MKIHPETIKFLGIVFLGLIGLWSVLIGALIALS